MQVSCRTAKTYDIPDYMLQEFVEFCEVEGFDFDFDTFMDWISDVHDLEDLAVDSYSEWSDLNGNPDTEEEFENIIEVYRND